MESTLFTTLTATEEASLSGGTSPKPKKEDKHKKEDKKKPLVVIPIINISVIKQLNVIAGDDNDNNVQANQVA